MMSLLRFTLASCLVLGSAAFAEKNQNSECTCTPEQTSKAFTNVAKKCIPAVVFIKVQLTSDRDNYGAQYQNPFDQNNDFFNRFFGLPPRGRQQQPQVEMTQGSGFLVTSDGYILTNDHVVKNAEKITVTLNTGTEMDATLVGCDPHTDLAVIKIEGTNFPYLELGDSEEMDIGEWVIAIGSPFQLEASLTVGVISAKGRQDLKITDLEDFIQTDAAINPGNSGGPLLSLKGEVIGINTAIVSKSGGYMGIGFAIPSNMAKNIMGQIIDKGMVTRGFLGVSLQAVDKDIAEAFGLDKAEGALISDVVKGSPADLAGLKQGDVILECNNTLIKSLATFRNEISLMTPGTTITLKINRKGEILNLPVTLGTASDELSAAAGVVQKLGIEVDNLTPELSKQLGYTTIEEGVVITKVKPGSPAAVVGMRPGYLIQAINHKKIANVTEFNDAINEASKSKRILMLVRQGNATRFYTIKID
ncbi:MAG: DegQ family serine endoprotease [Chlamydiota bacterium]